MEKEIPAVVPYFELKQMEPETTTAYPPRRIKRFITDLISLGIQDFDNLVFSPMITCGFPQVGVVLVVLWFVEATSCRIPIIRG